MDEQQSVQSAEAQTPSVPAAPPAEPDPYAFDARGVMVTNRTYPPKPYNPLNRPEIHFGKFTAALVVYLVCTAVLLFCFIRFSLPHPFLAWLGFSAVYGCIIGKKAVIWSVHVYQRLAPDHVRLRCVYTPSCSEYMIQSVQKYGLFRGVYGGIRRLLRCHPPNGGEDKP